MPIYEYDCQKCGTFEVTQRITEKPLGKCPTCKGKIRKLISNTSFQLKGTGWYITDYARKGKTADGKSEETAKPAADSKADGKKTKTETETKSSAEKAPTTSTSAST